METLIAVSILLLLMIIYMVQQDETATVEDDECLYCQDNLLIIGELFCCEDCYHEWHEENEDYYWCKKEKVYKN